MRHRPTAAPSANLKSTAFLPLEKLERGLKILQAFKNRVCANKAILDKGDLDVLARLDDDFRQHDEGKAGEAELPFSGSGPVIVCRRHGFVVGAREPERAPVTKTKCRLGGSWEPRRSVIEPA